MNEELTRQKVATFLANYREEEFASLLYDNDCQKYFELPEFQKGLLYGLELARVAVLNAFPEELEQLSE